MQHKYQRKEPFLAEQFDGSKAMMKKYCITSDHFDGNYTCRVDDRILPLKRNWWIVKGRTEVVFGLIITEWNTFPDDKFHEIFKRCD